MGKPVLDRVQSTTLQPIIINPKSVDLYHDAALLPIDRLSQADNIILDDEMIEKVPGTVKVSAGSLTTAAVMGLHRAYSPAGTKMALKLYNGTLYSTAAPSSTSKFGTTVLANLATNKRTPWVDIRGKAYGVNETDGIIRYDAATAVGVKTGIIGPYLRKKIAFFEDDETWSTTNAGSQTTIVSRPEEWTGKTRQSLKLYCSALSTTASAACTIPLNLTVFSDNKAVTDDDYISFYTFHSQRTNISCAKIQFLTGSTSFTNVFRADLDISDFENGDHQWTKWNIRRGAFKSLSGSPSWSKVSAVRIVAKSNTLGATAIYFDYMYLKPSPLKAAGMRRNIFNCEGANETWTFRGGANFSQKEHSEGLVSVKFITAGTSAACALTTPVDLSKWANGSTISDSDELVFHLRQTDVDSLSAATPLTLRIGSSPTDYYTRTFTTLSAIGMTGEDYWSQVRVPKVRLSAATNSPSWAAIDYIAFLTSAIGSSKGVYLDNCYFEQKLAVMQIAGFEDGTESWVFTGNGKFDHGSANDEKVTEGEHCIQLWSSNPGTWGESYATLSACPVADLSLWADGGNSGTDDEISFDLFHQRISKIQYVELWFDAASTTTFDVAFKYRVDKTQFGGAGLASHTNGTIRIAKEDFDSVGTSPSWSTIGAIKFIVMSNGSSLAGSVFIDNLQMSRASGKSGRYYYKYIFKVGDINSAASETSDYIDVQDVNTVLNNISTSQDSRVTSREVYRLGGTYPNTWGLVKTIDDNTTTEIVDDMDDNDIQYFISDEGDIPDGWINSVLCSNVIYDPYSDRALYWGDPTYKNRVWFSHQGFYHVVDEAGYREFQDDVQYVLPWFGQTIIFYRHGVQKIVDGDISTGTLISTPADVGAVSYYAVGKPWKGMIPYVGYDNVYLFDGIRSTPIGDDVKSYFKGRESYLSTVNVAIVKDTLYIACKDKTGTPTYNDTVLRCYLPTKSWTVLPDWNVNVWANFDKQDDNNDLFYGDSVTGDAYSINSTGYQFGSSNITSTVDTGWLSVPDGDIAIHTVEFKAKGTAASTLAFKGYINNGSSASTQGTITLTTAWQVFRIGPKGIMDILSGNNIKIEFSQTAQNAWFKMKDIIVYAERLPERKSITSANEITSAAP